VVACPFHTRTGKAREGRTRHKPTSNNARNGATHPAKAGHVERREGRTAAKQTKDDLRDKRPDPWPGANVLQKCMEPTPWRKRQPVAQFADAAEPSLGIPNGRRTGEMTLAKRPHSILPRTG
jgi:hypothetical protein